MKPKPEISLTLENARKRNRLKEFVRTHDAQIDAPNPKQRFNALLEAMAKVKNDESNSN